jgi:crossover junction endodeoxyribonuclease RusA
MKFTLPYPPSVNTYYRAINRGKFATNIMSAEGREYKAIATAKAIQQATGKHSNDVGVTLRLFRPRRAGDIDNRLKPVLDALNGIAYDDDSQIAELHAYRRDDKNNPRVEVEVKPVDE